MSAGRPPCHALHGRSALAALVVCGGLACTDQPVDPQTPAQGPFVAPPVVAEGEFVRIRSDFGESVAAGTPAAMDGFVRYAADLLELPLPPPSSIEYAWVPDRLEEAPCDRDGIVGCTIGTSIYTALLPHDHELVHAVTAHLPRADSFIEEGLAEAVAGARAVAYDLRRPAEMLGSDRTRDVDYHLAGRVMAYVLAEYGPAGVRELRRAAPQGSAGAEVSSAFERVTGRPFETLVEDSFENACTAPEPFDCTAPALTWMDDIIELDGDLTAGGTETVGVTGFMRTFDDEGNPTGIFWIPRTLVVDGPLQFETSRGHRIHFRRCDCPQEPSEVVGFEGMLNLPAGEYAVRFATTTNDTGPGWMTLARAD